VGDCNRNSRTEAAVAGGWNCDVSFVSLSEVDKCGLTCEMRS